MVLIVTPFTIPLIQYFSTLFAFSENHLLINKTSRNPYNDYAKRVLSCCDDSICNRCHFTDMVMPSNLFFVHSITGIIRSIRVWMNSMLIIWWHIQIKTDICANVVTFLLQTRWQPHPVAIVQIQLLSLQSLSLMLEEFVTQHLLKRLQGIYHW